MDKSNLNECPHENTATAVLFVRVTLALQGMQLWERADAKTTGGAFKVPAFTSVALIVKRLILLIVYICHN